MEENNDDDDEDTKACVLYGLTPCYWLHHGSGMIMMVREENIEALKVMAIGRGGLGNKARATGTGTCIGEEAISAPTKEELYKRAYRVFIKQQ